MRKYYLIMFVLFSLIFFSAKSFAQEAEQSQAKDQPVVPAQEEVSEAPQAEETTEFSYGTVKSVSEGTLVVTEYDYDNDKDIEVTYSVPATTTLDGVGQLNEIAPGDAVDIDYVVKGGERAASTISVEKGGAEDIEEGAPAEETEAALPPEQETTASEQ